MIRTIITGAQLGAVLGSDQVVAGLAKMGGKLLFKAHQANLDAGQDMVDLMRSRVPVDTGALLNGITLREEGDVVIVEASAIRGDFDYSRVVEFGSDDMAAEPFFLNSAEDVLDERGVAMEDAIRTSAAESGL